MNTYQFLVIWPAAYSLPAMQKVITEKGERQSDAYRRLWSTLDSFKVQSPWNRSELPSVLAFHGPIGYPDSL